MDRAVIVAIFGLCGLLSSVPVIWAQGEITIDSQYTFVNIGDEVKIVCTATIIDGTVQWTREYDNDPNLPLQTIADNVFLQSPFDQIDRYSMSSEQVGDTDIYKLTLTIANAQNEDSANYSCGFVGIQPYSERPKFPLIVTQKPTAMAMYVQKFGGDERELYDGDVLDFKGNETHVCNISCLVKGSNPAASVRIEIGDEDVTHLFEMFTTKNRLAIPGMPGVVKELYDVTAKAHNFQMSTRFADKELFCYAEVALQEPEQTLFTVDFEGFMPEFNCQTEKIAYVGNQIDITCTVRASPAPTDMHFSWPLKDDSNVILLPGKQNGQYSGAQEQDGQHVTRMVLRINRVGRQMFRKHQFVATNSFGTATHTVNIIPDPSYPARYNGAVVTCMLHSLLLIMTVTFHCTMFFI